MIKASLLGLGTYVQAVRQAVESVGCRLEISRQKRKGIIVCLIVVPKAPLARSPLCGIGSPITHCRILANTLFKKECASQRINNDNSYLLPAPNEALAGEKDGRACLIGVDL